MQIRKINHKRTFKDGIINTLYFNPRYLVLMLDLTYWISLLACLAMLLIGIFILNSIIIIVLGTIGSVMSVRNLYKHLRFKKYKLYDDDNFFARLERIHGGK